MKVFLTTLTALIGMLLCVSVSASDYCTQSNHWAVNAAGSYTCGDPAYSVTFICAMSKHETYVIQSGKGANVREDIYITGSNDSGVTLTTDYSPGPLTATNCKNLFKSSTVFSELWLFNE